MLSEEEIQEINTELAHAATKASASEDAHNIIQRHRGWVSDEALKYGAAMLDMTAEQRHTVTKI